MRNKFIARYIQQLMHYEDLGIGSCKTLKLIETEVSKLENRIEELELELELTRRKDELSI